MQRLGNQKIIAPQIEIQRDVNQGVTGILVRFSQLETCCYPLNMAYKLYAIDESGCKYTITKGLLIFR